MFFDVVFAEAVGAVYFVVICQNGRIHFLYC